MTKKKANLTGKNQMYAFIFLSVMIFSNLLVESISFPRNGSPNLPLSAQDSEAPTQENSLLNYEVSMFSFVYFKLDLSIKISLTACENIFFISLLSEKVNGDYILVKSVQSRVFEVENGTSELHLSFFPPLDEISKDYSVKLLMFWESDVREQFELVATRIVYTKVLLGPVFGSLLVSFVGLVLLNLIIQKERIKVVPRQSKTKYRKYW